MISIISGTNRPLSKSMVIANFYADQLRDAGIEYALLSLEDLPRDFVFQDLYGSRSTELNATIEKFVTNADKFVFVIPEYNGSFPGILKSFIDGIHPRNFRDKKAGIIGVSDGHAGNLRGQEHLTGILNYLKVHVHYNKPKISMIDQLVDENNVLTDERAMRLLKEHALAIANW